ncbi:hypothetical protein EMIT0373P_11272 [Pseudomonas chlororaphis]
MNQRVAAGPGNTLMVAKPCFLCSLLFVGCVFVVQQSLLNMPPEVNKHYGNPTFQFWKPTD